MSTIVQLALTTGQPLSATDALVALAERAGVTAIRLTDTGALDPTVTAGYLAGRHRGIGFVAEVPTTHHAPYNTARRILSLDRASGGRTGIVLRAGTGDEVSDVTAPDPSATGSTARWSEYARVLTRLWGSFPREALLGDQDAGLVVDDTLIRPIDHDGAFYRVAGPLDGPSSPQGRPVVVADLSDLWPGDPGLVTAAGYLDVVVTGRDVDAGPALTAALHRVGRSRAEVALLGRAEVGPAELADAATFALGLLAWAAGQRLDGFELVPRGDPEAVVRELVPRLAEPGGPPRGTLRDAFGLPGTAAVVA
ncbi:LLM class flavin-dependent oxidoreductase [Actinoplanes sp. NPDC051494]|uniref:LLM class flavin-dependent oxidoreductase n=1 Tax=Actinoplanes sp. NPDC051494 TaxID=3363907 RepID=UPI00379D0BCE